jgi:hypothetical protein
MDDIQGTSGSRIDAYRREPEHCLYCTAKPDTIEHVLPEAIGGRLTAPILCQTHNGDVNVGADEPLSKNFAPYVTMLQTPRQRGGAGAEFPATGADGNNVVIVAEGFAKQQPINVKRRDARNRIAYAEGDLDLLDSLPKAAFSDIGARNVIAKITLPEAQFMVASDDRIRPWLLKMALHFASGFVTCVSLEDAQAFLPYVTGQKPPTGDMVRTPFLDEEVFPEEWPPKHVITCYADGDGLLVTILLFGGLAYACRFPFGGGATAGVRYSQTLTKNYPEFHESVPRPAGLDWNKRPGASAADEKAWSEPVKRRLARIHEYGAEQSVRARCKRAFERALGESGNLGNLWERYAAALQLECFTAHEVAVVVAIGRRLRDEGKNAWEVPVSSEESA